MDFDHSKIQTASLSVDCWNPGYGDKDIQAHPDFHRVPIRRATQENLRGYGTIVHDFEKAEVEVRQWPAEGRRPVVPGTGVQAGLRSGEFHYLWKDDVALARNGAMEDSWGLFITGRLPPNVSPSNRTHVLVREANYHPDGGQVFVPKNGEPFVALLALPGDDVQPTDFVAFYFDGTFGLSLHPKVWHQPLYPIDDAAVYLDKQGANYACVNFDSVKEFGKFLLVPLKLDE